MALDNNACPTNSEILQCRTYGSISAFPVNITPHKITIVYKTGNANNNIPIDYVDHDWIMFVFVTATELGHLTIDSEYTSSMTTIIPVVGAGPDNPTILVITNNNGNVMWKALAIA